jgi:hypothetical protein
MDRAEATSVQRWGTASRSQFLPPYKLFDGPLRRSRATRLEATIAAQKMNRVFPYVLSRLGPVRVAMSNAWSRDLGRFEPHK